MPKSNSSNAAYVEARLAKEFSANPSELSVLLDIRRLLLELITEVQSLRSDHTPNKPLV